MGFSTLAKDWKIGKRLRQEIFQLGGVDVPIKGILYCIVLYLQPVLNPKSYDGARVLEASGRPMLVIGRSYFVSIQAEVEDDEAITGEPITKLAEETTE